MFCLINKQNTNCTGLAKHYVFFFLLYDIINQCHSGLGYHFLTRTCFRKEINAQIDSLSLDNLYRLAIKIITTG